MVTALVKKGDERNERKVKETIKKAVHYRQKSADHDSFS